MLYEKNKKNARLDQNLFKNPSSEYRGTPFWSWNCKLEKDELLRQIDFFEEMGFGGFHIHPRYGLDTEYLSEEFMELVKVSNEKAKEKGLYTWLYDEDRWPSGFAGGIVTKDEEYRQRFIVFTCNPDFKPRSSSILIGKYDIVLDENNCLESYKIVNDGDAVEGTIWTVWRMIAASSIWHNNQTYVDTLNPKAIERFVEVTHEKYYKTVGKDFGKNIPAIFTDEPQFLLKQHLKAGDSTHDTRLPWTDDFEDTYAAAYEESLIEHLPELLWELPNGKASVTRYRYHEHIAERFVSAYADTLGKWCNEHNIALTGHMATESTLSSQSSYIGDCMRSYRSFHIPGIDILCEHFEFTTAKQCQSAKRQYGREAMVSELYGVTGWDYDFRGHKIQGDWQAALGVTVRVPHLSWVSMKGVGKRDYPASIFYQSPWYKEYGYVENHYARINTALTRGKPIVKVAVIHPVESFWLHFGPDSQTLTHREKMNENFVNLAAWLVTGNIDFDYISESTLPDLCEEGSAPLKVGEMAYDVVVVPECETLRSTTLDRLEAFKKAGGKLVFMGDAPKYEDAKQSSRGKELFEKSNQIAFRKDALLSELEKDRLVEICGEKGAYTTNLLHQLRQDETGKWLFVAHSGLPYNKDVADGQKICISVSGTYTPELWDTVSGEIKAVTYKNEGGKTYIYTTVYDYDSLLFFLENTEAENSYTVETVEESAEEAVLPELVDYTLSEPNVLILDRLKFALDDGELEGPEEILRVDATLRERLGFPASQTTPWAAPKKTPEHTVTMEFTVHSEIDYDVPYLALEDSDAAKIYWNGEKVENTTCGYYVDNAIRKIALPKLNVGENILRVTIPFAERCNCEAMYLLGDFGVRVVGRRLTVVPLPEKIGFSDLTCQGLPFYGGEVSYHIPVTFDDERDVTITVPHFNSAVNTIFVEGEKKATVAYPPYTAELGKLSRGEHTVTLTAYISRRNAFGDVHNADEKCKVQSARAMKTQGSRWTYEYRLRRTGVISTPIIKVK